ncbi:hypothetical protein ScPMuIL_015215 [Solemya velum]
MQTAETKIEREDKEHRITFGDVNALSTPAGGVFRTSATLSWLSTSAPAAGICISGATRIPHGATRISHGTTRIPPTELRLRTAITRGIRCKPDIPTATTHGNCSGS